MIVNERKLFTIINGIKCNYVNRRKGQYLCMICAYKSMIEVLPNCDMIIDGSVSAAIPPPPLPPEKHGFTHQNLVSSIPDAELQGKM